MSEFEIAIKMQKNKLQLSYLKTEVFSRGLLFCVRDWFRLLAVTATVNRFQN